MTSAMLLRIPLRAALFATLLTLSASLPAQTASKAKVPPAKAYAALDALPDWSGIWTLDFASIAATMGGPPPALKGEYEQAYEAWQREVREHNGQVADDGSHCRPPGMPIIMMAPQYPIEFLFTPGRVTTHHEAWMQWRVIYTDGRPHPEDLDDTFNGHSIGHWEGGVLVVDTIGIKTSVALGMGIKHSDKVHILERIHLAKDDSNTLRDEMTIEDPLALEKPWSLALTFKRSRGEDLIEFVCEENDRNPVDTTGRTGFH